MKKEIGMYKYDFNKGITFKKVTFASQTALSSFHFWEGGKSGHHREA